MAEIVLRVRSTFTEILCSVPVRRHFELLYKLTVTFRAWIFELLLWLEFNLDTQAQHAAERQCGQAQHTRGAQCGPAQQAIDPAIQRRNELRLIKARTPKFRADVFDIGNPGRGTEVKYGSYRKE